MKRHRKPWTKEEDELLAELVGQYSFNYIANMLGRTPYAIERRLTRLGLLNTKAQGGWLSANQLANALKVEYSVIRRWYRKYGLPLKFSSLRYYSMGGKRRKMNTYRILPEEFWKWAEKHKDLLNFAKADPYTLAPIPDWFWEKQREDQRNIPKRQKQYWTSEEDQKLWNLFYHQGLSQKEIAARLGRSKMAVQKRLKRLRNKLKEEIT